MFRGEVQPDPRYRLEQVRIFLADEDYYRNLNFTEKLADIEAYITFLKKNKYKEEEELILEIKEMIWVHKCWITEATQPPTLNLQFAKFDHKNRLIGLVKDPKKRRTIAHIKAPRQTDRLFRSLDPGPATHVNMDDWNKRTGERKRPLSPDPFLYSKKVAKFRRAQDLIAATARVLDTNKNCLEIWPIPAPVNFNGPYIPLYNKSRKELSQRLHCLLGLVQTLRDIDIRGSTPLLRKAISIIENAIAKGDVHATSGPLTTADRAMLEHLHKTQNSSEVVTIDFLSDQKAVEEAARKVAYNIVSLDRLLRAKVDEDQLISKEFPAIQSMEEELRNRMATSLIEVAEPLSNGQFTSEQEAGRLLQKQIIAESHCNLEERRPEVSEIWAHGADIQKPKNFFSLDRWPLELQTRERHSEILKSGPERPSLKEVREKRRANRQLRWEKEVNMNPKETYVHGKPYFAFGETAFQEKALSWQIEQDLATGKS